MILATLVGVVALVWPSPQVQTIEQIASVEREAPRAEPARAAKPAAKAPARDKAKPAAAPAPPAVVAKMPAPNTTTRRSGALMHNGLAPPMEVKPGDNTPDKPATAKPPGARPVSPARPATPPRPGMGAANSAEKR